jgi:hypothetical protein
MIFMKTSVIIFVLLVSAAANSQIPLAHSKWKGRFTSPRSMEVQFNFTADTLFVTTEPSIILGALKYEQKHDSLTVTKAYGKSSCEEGIMGIYLITWLDNGSKFLLSRITDDCAERLGSFTTAIPFERIREEKNLPRN